MPLVQGRGIDHITLQVKNPDTSLAWYEGVFGFQPLRVEEWRRGAAPYPSLRISDTCVLNLCASPTKDVAGTACNLRSLAVRLDGERTQDGKGHSMAAWASACMGALCHRTVGLTCSSRVCSI